MPRNRVASARGRANPVSCTIVAGLVERARKCEEAGASTAGGGTTEDAVVVVRGTRWSLLLRDLDRSLTPPLEWCREAWRWCRWLDLLELLDELDPCRLEVLEREDRVLLDPSLLATGTRFTLVPSRRSAPTSVKAVVLLLFLITPGLVCDGAGMP